MSKLNVSKKPAPGVTNRAGRLVTSRPATVIPFPRAATQSSGMGGLVRDADGFNAQDILDLVRGKILAIRIRNFYSPKAAKRLAQKFLNSTMLSGYTDGKNTAEILRIGMSLYECIDPEREKMYFAQAQDFLDRMRAAAGSDVLPLDKARLHLDEIWPFGCTLWNIDAPGRKCFAGLVRAFADGGEARPHTDRCDWDVSTSADARAVECQLACNVYLCKEEGGQLELWNYRPTREAYEAIRLPNDYGLDRAKLPAPDIVLDPAPGELICFNASKVHAVRASKGGVRMAQSWFIAFSGVRQPLKLFS